MKGDSKTNITTALVGMCKPNDNRLPLSTTLEVIGKTNFPNVDKEPDILLFSDYNEMTALKMVSTNDKEKTLEARKETIDLVNTNPIDVTIDTIEKCKRNEVNAIKLFDQKSNKIVTNNQYVIPTINMKIDIESNCIKNNKQFQQSKNLVIDNEIISKKITAYTDNSNTRNLHLGKQNSQDYSRKQIVHTDSNTNIYKKKYKSCTEREVDRSVLLSDSRVENVRIISYNHNERNPHVIEKHIDSKHRNVTFVKKDSKQNFENNTINKDNSKIGSVFIDKEKLSEKDSEIVFKNMTDMRSSQTCKNNEDISENYKLIHNKIYIDNAGSEISTKIDTNSKDINVKQSGHVHECTIIQTSVPSSKINKSAVQDISVDKVTLHMKCQNEEKERDLLTIDKEIEEFKKFLEDEKFKFITLNRNCSRNNPKMWKPVEIESIPLIDVTATLKTHRLFIQNNRSLKYKNEFDLCLTPEPIEITGQAILVSTNANNSNFNSVVPNNSARSEYVEIHEENKEEERKDVAMKAYKKWKSFIGMKKKRKESEKPKLLPTDKKILEKYFDKWIKFWVDEKLQKRKLMRQQVKERKLADLVKAVVIKNKELKLENNISETKRKTNEKPIVKSKVKNGSEIFENRYKALLKIVEEQKEKLVIQKEMIVKLNEEHLLKESKRNIQKSKQEAENAIKKYDHRLKTKAKILKQNAETENHNNYHVLVHSMAQRAEEIRQANKLAKLKRAEIEEKRKLEEIELERMKKLKEEETKKALKIEKQRKKDLETRQYLETQLKRLKIERMISDANTYYEQKLLRKCFGKLKKTVELRNQRLVEACLHYEKNTVLKYFNKWIRFAADSTERKVEIANQFYYVSLLQKYWRAWCRHHEDCVRKKQVSIDLFEYKLQLKYFKRWCVFTSQQYLRSVNQIEEAKKYYERHLLHSAFQHWKQFTKLVHLYREQELRRQSWRHKVKEILPDFCPIVNDELET